MLATTWSAAEASAIWEELVTERKRRLESSYESGYASLEIFSSKQLLITRSQLEEWDASARAWLLAAQNSPIVKTRQIRLMLILKNISLDVSNRLDLYDNVMSAWILSLKTLENILEGGSYSVNDGAVLVALSAWHIYPDLIVFDRHEKIVSQQDELVPTSAQVTIGLERSDPGAGGVEWSLSLKHLRYYGTPPRIQAHVGASLERWTFSEFLLVITGALIAHWSMAISEVPQGLDLITNIVALAKGSRSREKRIGQHVLQELATAISWLRAHSSEEQAELEKLIYLGFRRSKYILEPKPSTKSFYRYDYSRSLSNFRCVDLRLAGISCDVPTGTVTSLPTHEARTYYAAVPDFRGHKVANFWAKLFGVRELSRKRIQIPLQKNSDTWAALTSGSQTSALGMGRGTGDSEASRSSSTHDQPLDVDSYPGLIHVFDTPSLIRQHPPERAKECATPFRTILEMVTTPRILPLTKFLVDYKQQHKDRVASSPIILSESKFNSEFSIAFAWPLLILKFVRPR